jgi:uncharacterized membrane protein YgcG
MIVRVASVVAVVVVTVVFGFAGPAQAAPGEAIRSYDTAIEVRADGDVVVVETIGYDFGAAPKHGIFRKIPVRYRYDDTRDRIYPLTGVTTAMDGAAVPQAQSSEGGYAVIRIGDQNLTVTGVHTYVIRYTVRGALNHFADHEELYWNAVGAEWSVPVGSATATVTAPAPIGRVDCFAGPRGSDRRCADRSASGVTASFRQPSLDSGAAMTVVVALPAGSVAGVGPVLVDRHDLATAFRVTPWTVAGALGLAGLSVAVVVAFAWRTGRDRRYVGVLPGLVPEHDDPVVEQRKPLVGGPPVSVEFTPPADIRPGQVGTLIDERADLRDVTATIVDFAVRKYLHIRQLCRPGDTTPFDWQLTKLTDPPRGLLPYERTLFRALFTNRDKVRLSELKGTIGDEVRKAREQLDADLVKQGWYKRSPKRTRTLARTRAVLFLLAAAAVTVVLAVTTHVALLGLGLVAGAVTLLALAGRFPARTGRGSAMLERVRGLRLYIATAEAEQIRFQERVQIFSRYLPYAMVFGLADRWAGVFSGIHAIDGEDLYWYGGNGFGAGYIYHDTIGGFNDIVVGAVGAAPPSATGASGFASTGSSGFSGGFSGGGGGGGGGGSW